MNEKRYLNVVEIGTNKIVKSIDVTGKSERAIERIERGMLINMNTDKFYVDDTGLTATKD